MKSVGSGTGIKKKLFLRVASESVSDRIRNFDVFSKLYNSQLPSVIVKLNRGLTGINLQTINNGNSRVSMRIILGKASGHFAKKCFYWLMFSLLDIN